jgi:hypothetical protein
VDWHVEVGSLRGGKGSSHLHKFIHQGDDELVYIAQGQQHVAPLAAAVGGVWVPVNVALPVALASVAEREEGDLVVRCPKRYKLVGRGREMTTTGPLTWTSRQCR